MAFLYYDESIRERGGFIVAALVISDVDLTQKVNTAWLALGLNPATDEYKSSGVKVNNEVGQMQREVLRDLLGRSRLGLVICSNDRRGYLGDGCAELIFQLVRTQMLAPTDHDVYLDQNIKMKPMLRERLQSAGIKPFLNQDSKLVSGLQVADHAAHALGGMLLQKMGLTNKKIKAGEGSGYDPDTEIELGFELWAGLRYSLIGSNEKIDKSVPSDPTNPYFLVDGFGLHLDPQSPAELLAVSMDCFGVNYLGSIH